MLRQASVKDVVHHKQSQKQGGGVWNYGCVAKVFFDHDCESKGSSQKNGFRVKSGFSEADSLPKVGAETALGERAPNEKTIALLLGVKHRVAH